jgi:hypothetical protein
MTPKEKAKELVNNTGKIIGKELKNGSFKYNFGIAKHCALIAIDELIYETQFEVPNIRQRYWINVKEEINKL